MKRTAPAVIVLAAGLIAGCSTPAPNGQKLDYQPVGSTHPDKLLEVPPDLTAPVIQDKYTIPTVGTSSPLLPDITQKEDNSTSTNTMRLERAGNERWLVVVDKSPEQLWPILKAFWQDNGFVIKTEEPSIGIMETDWAENRAKLPHDILRNFLQKIGLGSLYSTSQRDKFRIRLEKTTAGTEIYFSHRGMEEIYVSRGKTETRWQPRTTDTGLEAELLTRFMIRLGMKEEQARDSVKKTLAQNDIQKAPISDGTLTINDSFERAWRRVGLALDRIGLVVNDRDRSQGLYYVKPAKNDDDTQNTQNKSLWSGLAFWKNKENNLASPTTNDDLIVEVQQGSANAVNIRFIDKQGNVLKNEWARAALNKLANSLQ